MRDICGIHHQANPCPSCRPETVPSLDRIAEIRARFGVQTGRAKTTTPERKPTARETNLTRQEQTR